MKISEYPSITNFTEDNILLVDGNQGTKKMLVTDAILAALHMTSVKNHRLFFRGKNLGATITSEQKTAIQNGTFEGLWLGDYWEINGVNWRIVDFDYWYGTGSPAFNSHHIVVMPDTSLDTAGMNDSSVTTGGYVGSKMYTTNMATAKAAISSVFGSNLLSHREFLTNAVTNGYPSAGTWTDSTVDLPNEIMIYGSYIYTPCTDGVVDVKRYTNSNVQLALFQACPSFIVSGTGYWLRDVVSATHFARVDNYGGATATGAVNAYGIRPVFAVG